MLFIIKWKKQTKVTRKMKKKFAKLLFNQVGYNCIFFI